MAQPSGIYLACLERLSAGLDTTRTVTVLSLIEALHCNEAEPSS